MTVHFEQGRLIVFDGGEGSGKGTVLRALQQEFPEPGAIFTREPGGTPLAEAIRGVLLSDLCKDASAESMLALFFAARADHVQKKIRPALRSGVNVITDRYDSSSAAYQLRAMKGFHLRHLFTQMRSVYCEGAIPYLYVYLDIDPEEGLRRVANRADSNHLDDREIEFHREVRCGYREYIAQHSHKVIDASQPIDVVVAECLGVMHAALD
ncbi:dTMP kinase [Candidatus Parcubacteria bacterium]|nr:dTMP kinase [Candidatus Parcubacteria bacterium]